jgi:hypothetical protein
MRVATGCGRCTCPEGNYRAGPSRATGGDTRDTCVVNAPKAGDMVVVTV